MAPNSLTPNTFQFPIEWVEALDGKLAAKDTQSVIVTRNGSYRMTARELFTRLESLMMVVRFGADHYKNTEPTDPFLVEAKEFAEFLAGDSLADGALAVINEVETAYLLRNGDIEHLRHYISANRQRIYNEIAERDGEACKHCGTAQRLEIDHIQALSRGGTNEMGNLQFLCRTCNGKKGAR